MIYLAFLYALESNRDCDRLDSLFLFFPLDSLANIGMDLGGKTLGILLGICSSSDELLTDRLPEENLSAYPRVGGEPGVFGLSHPSFEILLFEPDDVVLVVV